MVTERINFKSTSEALNRLMALQEMERKKRKLKQDIQAMQKEYRSLCQKMPEMLMRPV